MSVPRFQVIVGSLEVFGIQTGHNDLAGILCAFLAIGFEAGIDGPGHASSSSLAVTRVAAEGTALVKETKGVFRDPTRVAV